MTLTVGQLYVLRLAIERGGVKKSMLSGRNWANVDQLERHALVKRDFRGVYTATERGIEAAKEAKQ